MASLPKKRKPKLDGRPLAVVKELKRATTDLWHSFPSRRAWGKLVAPLVHELAKTNLEVENFASFVDAWVVEAIRRERDRLYLESLT